MRIEYNIGIEQVERPRFSVEATEGPPKLFTLATLILNVVGQCDRVDVVFHSANPDEPHRKIEIFQRILASAPGKPSLEFEEGESGSLGGAYFRWLGVKSRDAG